MSGIILRVLDKYKWVWERSFLKEEFIDLVEVIEVLFCVRDGVGFGDNSCDLDRLGFCI